MSNKRDTNIPLTELQVRSAKPHTKVRKLSDGGGLQLWVTPDGAKRWRLAYRFGGGQKLMAIGVYPTVSLKEARAAREKAKRFLTGGLDPSEVKKQAKIERVNASENTFAAIAAELIDKKRREGKAGATICKGGWQDQKGPVLAPKQGFGGAFHGPAGQQTHFFSKEWLQNSGLRRNRARTGP